MTVRVVYPGSTVLGIMNNNVERITTTYSATGISSYPNFGTITIPEDTDGNGYSRIVNLTIHSRNDYKFDSFYSMQVYINGVYFTYLDRLKIPWGTSVPVITASNPIYLNGINVMLLHNHLTTPLGTTGATGGSGNGLSYDITVERYYD